jgi:hypothetical protein
MELLLGHEKIITKSGISLNAGTVNPGFTVLQGAATLWDGKTGVDSFALKMKSVGSSKIMVNLYHITHWHIPKQPVFFKCFLTSHTALDIISIYCEANHATDTTLSDIIFHHIL